MPNGEKCWTDSPPKRKPSIWGIREAEGLSDTVAFLDASVLYPAPLRDLLLECAVSDLYRARWSDAVHQEWMNAVLRDRPDLTKAQLERTRDLMNAHTRDALVTDFDHLIPELMLPDRNDWHVLAAALTGEASVIAGPRFKGLSSKNNNFEASLFRGSSSL